MKISLAVIVMTILVLPYGISNVAIAQSGDEGPQFCKAKINGRYVKKTVKMMVTAYSSTPDQTDDTPFITASGARVEDGIIANNMLPFNTKVRIPELFGDKVFVNKDRMHQRKGNFHADVWMASTLDAKNFGAKIATVEVLDD